MIENSKKQNSRSAFTIVEAAIVVVVVAIVISGIIGGVALVDNSKRNRVIADYKKYKSAYTMFVKQYHAVPGDMADASTTFKPFGGGSVYNGDGNEILWQPDESGNVFAHLSLAELITGRFNVAGDVYPDVAPQGVEYLNTIFPSGPHENAGYYIANTLEVANQSGWSILQASDISTLGSTSDNSLLYSNSLFYMNFNLTTEILTPTDVNIIDQKIDDGLYLRGSVSGLEGSDSSPGECGNILDGSYVADDKNIRCIFMFNLERRQGAH